MDGGFGGAIDRDVCHRRERESGTHVDDHGLRLLPQQWQHFTDQMNGRREVDRHFLIQVLERSGIGEAAAVLNSGIVDDDVQAGMSSVQPSQQGAATLGVSDVADPREQRRYLGFRFLKSLFASSADDDAIASFRQLPRKGESNAGCAACNEDSVCCQIHGRTTFLVREGV